MKQLLLPKQVWNTLVVPFLLPSGGYNTSESQFGLLFGENGSNIGEDIATAFNNIQIGYYKFPPSGYFYGGALGLTGTDGFYRSNRAVNSAVAYSMLFSKTYFFPGTYISAGYGHDHGLSVRCITAF